MSRHKSIVKSMGAQHVRAANLQADGLVRDALVGARKALRLGHDLSADAVKVVEALARAVQKLAPLWRAAARAARRHRLLHLRGASPTHVRRGNVQGSVGRQLNACKVLRMCKRD